MQPPVPAVLGGELFNDYGSEKTNVRLLIQHGFAESNTTNVLLTVYVRWQSRSRATPPPTHTRTHTHTHERFRACTHTACSQCMEPVPLLLVGAQDPVSRVTRAPGSLARMAPDPHPPPHALPPLPPTLAPTHSPHPVRSLHYLHPRTALPTPTPTYHPTPPTPPTPPPLPVDQLEHPSEMSTALTGKSLPPELVQSYRVAVCLEQEGADPDACQWWVAQPNAAARRHQTPPPHSTPHRFRSHAPPPGTPRLQP
jgi:hypothetical protein